MNKYLMHLKTICKHKYYVFNECRKCGITWQGIVHDLSKFGPVEFISSAKYFQGDRSPIEAEKEAICYSRAWLHHKGHNKHHWEYWTDFDDEGNLIANKMPYKYVIEMICDFVGAGKAYSSDKWTPEEPLNYWNKVRKGRYFHPHTDRLAGFLLDVIATEGLKKFHSFAKSKGLQDLYEKGRIKGGKEDD